MLKTIMAAIAISVAAIMPAIAQPSIMEVSTQPTVICLDLADMIDIIEAANHPPRGMTIGQFADHLAAVDRAKLDTGRCFAIPPGTEAMFFPMEQKAGNVMGGLVSLRDPYTAKRFWTSAMVWQAEQ